MPEVQNVGAVDYAQYQPSQYVREDSVNDFNAQPMVYDERAEEIRTASKSRMGATLLSLAVIGGLALWGGHALGKKSAAKEIEKLSDAASKYKEAQKAMDEVEKLAQEGNDCYFGSDHCGNKLLENIKNKFKSFKEAVENAGEKTAEKAGEKAEGAADEVVKAAEDVVK